MRTAFAFIIFAAILLFLAAPVAGVLAQTPGSGNTGQTDIRLVNPLKADSFSGLLTDILDFVVQIGTVVVILMIVYVGFMFVVARGNDGKISEARQALLWTLVGALILLGAKAISLGIQATVQALGG